MALCNRTLSNFVRDTPVYVCFVLIFQNIVTEKVLFDEDVKTSGSESLMKLPFDDESVDIVTSSLSLHWVNNLPGYCTFVNFIILYYGIFNQAYI